MVVAMQAFARLLLLPGPTFGAEIFMAGTTQAMTAKTMRPASFSVSHLFSFQSIQIYSRYIFIVLKINGQIKKHRPRMAGGGASML
jgi:hypothetical protein